MSFGPWMEEIVEFSRHLKSIDIDLTAFSCLAALAIVHGKTNTCMATHGSHFLADYFLQWVIFVKVLHFFTDRHGVSEPKKLELMETRIVEALRHHCTDKKSGTVGGHKYFTQITELIVARSAANGGRSVLRSLGESGLRRIGAMRPLEAMVPIPASIDKLFTAANSTFEF